MNTHAKDAGDLLSVIADTMAFPASSDYVCGGSPWILLGLDHARLLKQQGYDVVTGEPDVFDSTNFEFLNPTQFFHDWFVNRIS